MLQVWDLLHGGKSGVQNLTFAASMRPVSSRDESGRDVFHAVYAALKEVRAGITEQNHIDARVPQVLKKFVRRCVRSVPLDEAPVR